MTTWIAIAHLAIAWLVWAGLLRKHYAPGKAASVVPATLIIAMVWPGVLALAFLFAPVLAVRYARKEQTEDETDAEH